MKSYFASSSPELSIQQQLESIKEPSPQLRTIDAAGGAPVGVPPLNLIAVPSTSQMDGESPANYQLRNSLQQQQQL
jgi:hypothetical protein